MLQTSPGMESITSRCWSFKACISWNALSNACCERFVAVTSITAPTYSRLPDSSLMACATTWTSLTDPSGSSKRCSSSQSFSSWDARSMSCWTRTRSSGCVRCRISSKVGLVAGSWAKMQKVSSDQKSSLLETLQPKLPVRLNLWASAKYASLRRRASSARLRSVFSCCRSV